ncbi:MAG: TRAP transporter substrate-binding protein [Hyphomonadaceae bacterium]|jgi:TRAP-type mannitol/chloroaromatic compound transport system substrate-binding protein|nr:TRAP transporter substrate-binding protein [Hyphomonadaceae bacterium]
MKRRQFLQAGGVALAAGLATPAIAQSAPTVRWRLTTTFPKSLDTLYGACEMFSKIIAELSDQKFQVQVFGPGEIVPPFQVLDAVSSSTVEMGNTASYYYIGKDLAFAFGTAVPFGPNTRQMNAWLTYGGGLDLLNTELYKTYNVTCLPFGNTAAQMGGWFRKEIKTVEDLKGLKFRIGGLAGQVVARLGGVPQQIPPADIYPALEKGTIDAAEWIGPYDDEKLGFVKIAPYYYYPGWWEGSANGSVFINLAKWAELPKPYQQMVTTAAAQVAGDLLAKYDARNAPAIKRLVASGARLRPFSIDILDACYKATNELFAEIGSKNALFKRLNESMSAFRNEQYAWHQVCEATYDNYQIRQLSRT